MTDQNVSDLGAGVGDTVAALLGGVVRLQLEVQDHDVSWHVEDIHIHERLGAPFEARVRARCALQDEPDEEDLLAKDVSLTIERGDERRRLRGVVRDAWVERRGHHVEVHLGVVPALWLASETLDSRIYQNLTVPDLVQRLVRELLGSRARTVRNELSETYPTHEYLVQYRESHARFIERICEEEGIFYYFDHDADGESHEVLVLADSNENRPLVRPAHDGRVDFGEPSVRGREVAYGVRRQRQVGATDAVVRGFDWTNPSASVEHARTERRDWGGPRLERYDHHHAVRYHDYGSGGDAYGSHTATRRARFDTERLDLSRQSWVVDTTVVSAEPGRILDLQGAGHHDGRYFIVAATTSAHADEASGELHATLDVVPADVPYRPAAPARPVMPGPETAIVVGPSGEEIHTDRHGRVKVQFHWDRLGRNDDASSAWIRVAQSWAGPGWGTSFIPRIGMEVIVSFLGGDPERPIVTGCVYNGANMPPYALPEHKTRSTIKTNTSMGGNGYNELRFEDKASHEQIWLHAQKDLDEVVLNDHTTRVRHDQTERVDHDQSITVCNDRTKVVEHDEKCVVKHDQVCIVENDQTCEVHNDQSETVKHDASLVVEHDRVTAIRHDDRLTVSNERTVNVMGGLNEERYEAGSVTTVFQNDRLSVIGSKGDYVHGEYSIGTVGKFTVHQLVDTKLEMDSRVHMETPGAIELHAGGAPGTASLRLESSGGAAFQCIDDFGCRCRSCVISANETLVLDAAQSMTLSCGGSRIRITPTSIEISSGSVTVNGGASVELHSPATRVT